MAVPTKAKQWILTNKPTGLPVLDGDKPTWTLKTNDLRPLKDGEVLLQPLYLSNDPAQRAWISPGNADPERAYFRPPLEGEVMPGYGIWKVVDTKAEDSHPKGTLVIAMCGWTEYAIADAKACQKIQEIPNISITHYIGALGGTGLTAYYGLVEIIGAKAGESLVVSGAAGATGQMVVQIAKHIVGCSKIIGLAGSNDKCKWVESLGADKCINYKDSNWKEQLKQATDGYVDMYFDNVGGEQLDFMLGRLKKFGRIAACGAISGYNSGEPYGVKNWFQIIGQRLMVKGFIVIDYRGTPGQEEAMKKVIALASAGKIKMGDEIETVVDTKFEDIPQTWLKLFSGANRGKLVTKVV